MKPAPLLAALLTLACAAGLVAPKAYQTFEGKVVSITDGDTITVLDDAKAQHKVRLLGIDAPELKQPFSQGSKQALVKKVFGKRVAVKWRDKDRNGRLLGVVTIDGRNVNSALVAEGWAWHFVRYTQSKGLEAAEKAGRAKQIGLWAGENPIAPWDWRKLQAELRAEMAKRPPSKPSPPVEDVRVEAFVDRPLAPSPLGRGSSGDRPATAATVFVTRTGDKYHRAGCRSLAKSGSPLALVDAKGRYSPCQLCDPPQ